MLGGTWDGSTPDCVNSRPSPQEYGNGCGPHQNPRTSCDGNDECAVSEEDPADNAPKRNQNAQGREFWRSEDLRKRDVMETDDEGAAGCCEIGAMGMTCGEQDHENDGEPLDQQNDGKRPDGEPRFRERRRRNLAAQSTASTHCVDRPCPERDRDRPEDWSNYGIVDLSDTKPPAEPAGTGHRDD